MYKFSSSILTVVIVAILTLGGLSTLAIMRNYSGELKVHWLERVFVSIKGSPSSAKAKWKE